MELVKTITDKRGNRIVIRDGKIVIYLKEKEEKRAIGNIKNSQLIVTRNYDKHLFYKIGGYGYNSDLLHYLQQNGNGDMVVITKQSKSKVYYKSTVNAILEKGIYQTHSLSGFEVQIVMKLSDMEVCVK